MENNHREFKTGDRVRIIESIGADNSYPVGSVIELGESIGGYFRIQGDKIGFEITKHYIQHIDENPLNETKSLTINDIKSALEPFIDLSLIDDVVTAIWHLGR